MAVVVGEKPADYVSVASLVSLLDYWSGRERKPVGNWEKQTGENRGEKGNAACKTGNSLLYII